MNEYRTLIDNNGYIIDACVFADTTEEGNIVPYCDNGNLVKPKWDGSTWIEGATEEEINKWKEDNNIILQPTPDEILRAKILKDNVSMQLQLASQQKINADILLKLAKVGGITNA